MRRDHIFLVGTVKETRASISLETSNLVTLTP